MSGQDDLEQLNREAQRIWDTNAGWWDDVYGEGNAFQRELTGPATERLLQPKSGETILDVACGNGAFARRMAAMGCYVVAFDFSEVFLQRARLRTTEHVDRIEYHLTDATDEAALLRLGEGKFDAAVATMALMDMSDINPLMRAVTRLLKPGGRFVFSVLHPCFNHDGMSMLAEHEDVGGEFVTQHAIKVKQYRTNTVKGIGIPGQPVAQLYFERTLSDLFGAAFAAGLVLDGLEEPLFGSEAQPARPFSWQNYKSIPPALIVRLRRV
jgi:2-polyprenyl-3-methyl-5-hydroxy-6-metoxy-1,4-benzoquinol methylase